MLAQDALQAVLDFADADKVSAVSLSWGFNEAQTGKAAVQVRVASTTGLTLSTDVVLPAPYVMQLARAALLQSGFVLLPSQACTANLRRLQGVTATSRAYT